MQDVHPDQRIDIIKIHLSNLYKTLAGRKKTFLGAGPIWEDLPDVALQSAGARAFKLSKLVSHLLKSWFSSRYSEVIFAKDSLRLLVSWDTVLDPKIQSGPLKIEAENPVQRGIQAKEILAHALSFQALRIASFFSALAKSS